MIEREDNFQPFKLERTRDRIAHVFSYRAQQILLPLMVITLELAIWQFHWTLLIAVIAGVLFQYGNEYALHRFVYHMTPPADANGLFLWLYKSHIGHHDFPNNPNLWGGTSLWFAPTFAGVTFVLLWGGLSLGGLAQSWLYAASFVFIGSVGLYLTYEWCHVTAHAVGQKNALEKYITREHAKHHFADFNTNFHVTAGGILVDQLGGTANQPSGKKVEKIRTLGLDPSDARLVKAREKWAAKFNITPRDQQTALL